MADPFEFLNDAPIDQKNTGYRKPLASKQFGLVVAMWWLVAVAVICAVCRYLGIWVGVCGVAVPMFGWGLTRYAKKIRDDQRSELTLGFGGIVIAFWLVTCVPIIMIYLIYRMAQWYNAAFG